MKCAIVVVSYVFRSLLETEENPLRETHFVSLIFVVNSDDISHVGAYR